MSKPVIPATLHLSPLLKSIDDKLSHVQDFLELVQSSYAADGIKEARALLLKGIFQGFINETSPDTNIHQNKEQEEEEQTQQESQKETAEKILQIEKEQTP